MKVFNLSISTQGAGYFVDVRWRKAKMAFPLSKIVAKALLYGSPFAALGALGVRLFH